jgi:hypothetical protein
LGNKGIAVLAGMAPYIKFSGEAIKVKERRRTKGETLMYFPKNFIDSLMKCRGINSIDGKLGNLSMRHPHGLHNVAGFRWSLLLVLPIWECLHAINR